jgi:hypothetical protein
LVTLVQRLVRIGSGAFRDSSFVEKRMQESEELLELAVGAIERWSAATAKRLSGWTDRFLQEISRRQSRPSSAFTSDASILLSCVEKAVLHHAAARTSWWASNCERICFSDDGALRYMGLLALAEDPQENAAVAARVLLDTIPTGRFISEVRQLLSVSFFHLVESAQDEITSIILKQAEKPEADGRTYLIGAQYLRAIPAPLRSRTVVERIEARQLNLPLPTRSLAVGLEEIADRITDQRFIALSDDGVLAVLKHFAVISDASHRFSAFLEGANEAGPRLREAASRQPRRFLDLLAKSWTDIPVIFREPMFFGAVDHLLRRFGRVQASGEWKPIEDITGSDLGALILDELERHPLAWGTARIAAEAIQGSGQVVESEHDANRLLFLAASFVNSRDDGSMDTDPDLVTAGLNCSRGCLAIGLTALANRCADEGRSWPVLLRPIFRQFANDPRPAVRAVMLRELPFLVYKQPVGLETIKELLVCEDDRILPVAESCFYRAYQSHYPEILPYLERCARSQVGEARETWGRITALSSLSGLTDLRALLSRLVQENNSNAWIGATSVWVANAHLRDKQQECFDGLTVALRQPTSHQQVVSGVEQLFRGPAFPIPLTLLSALFGALKTLDEDHATVYGFEEWLCGLVSLDPDLALSGAQLYADSVAEGVVTVYDHEPVSRLLTLLFREAEEREEVDDGITLRAVVGIQDAFLAGHLDGLESWLRDAERP